MAVDFFVPVRDHHGRAQHVPTHAFNRYGYDLDYEQIAAALDSSPDAARQAASSGVRRLRRSVR